MRPVSPSLHTGSRKISLFVSDDRPTRSRVSSSGNPSSMNHHECKNAPSGQTDSSEPVGVCWSLVDNSVKYLRQSAMLTPPASGYWALERIAVLRSSGLGAGPSCKTDLGPVSLHPSRYTLVFSYIAEGGNGLLPHPIPHWDHNGAVQLF